ncbi:hypothetical protein ACLOJK_008674 [Asimina triloba]
MKNELVREVKTTLVVHDVERESVLANPDPSLLSPEVTMWRGSPKMKERGDARAFQQQHPPSFAEGDNTTTENWLFAINKILEFLGCSNRQKVMFAAFKLDINAYR